MNCKEAKLLLSLYLDDELDPPGRDKVARHLQQCVSCEREMADLAKTMQFMQAVEMVEPPRDYWNLTMDSNKATTKE